jgi:hypothetical protein
MVALVWQFMAGVVGIALGLILSWLIYYRRGA